MTIKMTDEVATSRRRTVCGRLLTRGLAATALLFGATIGAFAQEGAVPEVESAPGRAEMTDDVGEELAIFESLLAGPAGQGSAASSTAPMVASPDSDGIPYSDQEMWADGLGGCTPEGCLDYAEGDFARRWNLTFVTGYEYDTNVPLAPQFTGLGSNFGREDSRAVAALFGDYRLVQEANWNLGVTGSALSTWQFELDQFNAQNYMGGAYVNFACGDWLWSSYYQYHDTLLDSDEFANSHRISGSVTYQTPDWHTTGYYEFERLELDVLAMVPAQIRSGDVNSVGLTQAFYLAGGLGRLFLGYRFDDADTEGSDFVRQTNQVNARIETPLSTCEDSWLSSVVFDVGVRHFWDDYAHPNSLDFFGRERSDQRLEVRTGLQRFLSDNLSVRMDYTYVDSNSNVRNLFDVGFYSYTRHILSTQLIYDF